MTGTKIADIVIDAGRVQGVRAVDGRELRSPIVVSSAGIHPTILKLVGEQYFEPDYVERVKTLQPAWGLTSQIYFLKEPVLDFDMAVAYSDDAWWDLAKCCSGSGPRLSRRWSPGPTQDPPRSPTSPGTGSSLDKVGSAWG
jgi:hypothetical protein